MKKIVIKLILAFIMFEGTSCINDPIIISPDLAFRAEATTGEGSIWHPDRNTLFWVDIEGKTLYEYIPDLQNCRSWQFDRMVSTVVPETDSTVVVALQNEIIRVNLTDGNTTSIAPIPDNNEDSLQRWEMRPVRTLMDRHHGIWSA